MQFPPAVSPAAAPHRPGIAPGGSAAALAESPSELTAPSARERVALPAERGAHAAAGGWPWVEPWEAGEPTWEMWVNFYGNGRAMGLPESNEIWCSWCEMV